MTQIQPFTFPDTGESVRTLLADGEPYVCHADVCRLLRHSNPSVAIRLVDDDDKRLIDLSKSDIHALKRGVPGNGQTWFLTESGFYTLALSSTAPGAQKLRRWVTREVIPSIRKTGSYSITQVSRKELARLVIEAEEAREEAENRAAFAEHQVQEMAPAVHAFDAFLAAPNSNRLAGQVAKMLGWNVTRLRSFLVAEGLVFVRYRPCNGSREYNFKSGFEAHFAHKETVVYHDESGACSHYTLYITPRGMDLIRKRIADQRVDQQLTIEGGAL